MTLSRDADILWHTALALARRTAPVSPHARKLPPLLFFTDPERTPEPWLTVRNMPAGSGVVFRAFSRPDAVETGKRLRDACDSSGVRLLVGRDEVLAEAVGADGLHLPEVAMESAAEIRREHPDWIVTCALHGPLDGRKAPGIDAFVVSPVFQAGGASASKPRLGVESFQRLISALPCPAYGLGGISADNADRLLETQACGIAGVDAIRKAFGG